MSANLTQDRLKELLHYAPETGVFTWRVNRSPRIRAGRLAGCVNGKGYWQIRVEDKIYRAGRLAFLYMTGSWPKEQVDHINRVTHDDRWCNLREATHSQNQGNRDGILGIFYMRSRNCWRAYIAQDYLGEFATKEAAAGARRDAAVKHFGEFANV